MSAGLHSVPDAYGELQAALVSDAKLLEACTKLPAAAWFDGICTCRCSANRIIMTSLRTVFSTDSLVLREKLDGMSIEFMKPLDVNDSETSCQANAAV